MPVLPTHAVVDDFASPQHFDDLAFTCRPPCTLRLEDHPISNPALHHRLTSSESWIAIQVYVRRTSMELLLAPGMTVGQFSNMRNQFGGIIRAAKRHARKRHSEPAG